MSKTLLGIVIGVFALYAYQRAHRPPAETADVASEPELQFSEQGPAPAVEREASSSDPRCDGRTHCSQMTSCEEATYFLRHCPNVAMDGNNDGVPCERQWCRN